MGNISDTSDIYLNDMGVYFIGDRDATIALRAVHYIIATAIIFLNGLTLAAICKFRNLKNGTNYLICSLSLADLSLGIIIPVCVSMYGLGNVCQICFFFISTSLSVSLTTIVAIALERFFAVVYPLKHKVHMNRKVVIAGILGIWVFETTVVLINILTYEPEYGTCYMFGISNWLSILMVLHVGLYIVVCTIVYTKMYFVAVEHMQRVHGFRFAPLRQSMYTDTSSSDSTKSRSTTMSSLSNSNHGEYGGNHGDEGATVTSKILADSELEGHIEDEEGVIVESGNHGNKHKHNHGNKQSSNQCKGRCDDCINIKVARMTFLVLVVMVMCWLPFLVSNAIRSVHGNAPSTWQHWFFKVSLLILYCNSFLNPILYSWQIAEFRKAFRVILCRACRNKKGRGRGFE